MLPLTMPVSFAVLSGVLGLVVGALIQQDRSFRNLHSQMENDAYIYQRREQIFDALRLVGNPHRSLHNVSNEDQEDGGLTDTSGDLSVYQPPTENEPASVVANYVEWLQINMNTVTMFFTFSLGKKPQRNPTQAHVAAIMKYGFPGLDDIHVYRNFVLSYDRRNKIAHWVCEHLESNSLTSVDAKIEQQPPDFTVDTSLARKFRADMRDYRNTDWAAIQMAAPQNYHCDPLKYRETFIITNIAPAHRNLKAKVWNRLEAYVRELAIKCGSVYVYTGPLFMPQRITFRNWAIRHQVIGLNTVAVPSHFFKVIVAECKGESIPYMEGYVVPNAAVDGNLELTAYMSNIRDIERFTGLSFYGGLQTMEFSYPDSDNF